MTLRFIHKPWAQVLVWCFYIFVCVWNFIDHESSVFWRVASMVGIVVSALLICGNVYVWAKERNKR